MIDVCICTHSARPGSLRRTIASIAAQVQACGRFRALVVDNKSHPPVPDEVLSPLRALGIEARIVREEVLGITRARLRAIAETAGEWVLFVDDDNEVAPDYIAVGAEFIRTHPRAGCLGGRCSLPGDTRVPRWAAPFLPYLAIIDHGDADIVAMREGWGPWEPPCAGAWVHRSVLTEFARRLERDPRGFALGRVGKRGLGSCEDSLMMRGSVRAGRESAYVPALKLVHHIPPNRLRLVYLIRLLRAFGRSHMLLQSMLEGGMPTHEHYDSARAFWELLKRAAQRDCRHSVPFALAQAAYHLAARAEYRRQRRRNPLPVDIALAR